MRKATFPGRYESLAKIAEFVIQAAKDAGMDDKAIYAVQLAVDEACSNIIEHAYGGEDKGDIECICEDSDNVLKVTLRDKAPCFDLDGVPDPILDVPLEKRKVGGLGIFLMRKMMDEVHYKTTAEGNEMTLVKVK